MTVFVILQKTALAGLILLLPVVELAGQVKFTVVANNEQISLEDYLQVQYTVENVKKVDQFIPPRFTEFQVIRGPELTSGWSLVNGKLRQYNTFTYVLKPLRKGRFFVPAATAKTDAGSIRSNTVAVEVVKVSNSHSRVNWPSEDRRSFDEFILRNGETIQDKIRNNLFIRLEVNKSSCYEGEPVVATYKLYTRLKSESKVVKRPSFSGFSVYDMTDPDSENAVKEKLNGKEYHVYLLRKAQLFPLQTGTIELEPAEVENIVTFVRAEYAEQGYSMTDLLNALSSDRTPDEYTVKEKVTLMSRPMNIEVKPLPVMNRPSSYNGAVGEFSISALVTRNSLSSNDVANLNLVIKGKGNLPMLSAPEINWPDSFEIFEPVISDKINKYFAPIEGSRNFSFAFSPKMQGDFIIPAVKFSYFDPDSGKYRTAKTDSIKINVSAISEGPSAAIANIDIVEKNLWDVYPWLKWIMVFFTLGIGTLGFYVLQRSCDTRTQKEKSASVKIKEAEMQLEEVETLVLQQSLADPLKKAKAKIDSVPPTEFYHILKDEMYHFLQKKFGTTSDSPEMIRNQLMNNGASPELIKSLNQVISDCELAMFTPVNMEKKMKESLSVAESAVMELNKINP